MALSPDNYEAAVQIIGMHHQRRTERAGHFNRMEEMKNSYNGGIILALPELDDSEKPAVANLMAQGIDQIGMRTASIMPNIIYPALRPDIQVSMNKADDRRKANLGWWEMNSMQIKLRRRARHLVAYGMSVVSLSAVSLNPKDMREIPFWRVREPLSTFPAQMIDYDDMEPSDCIFTDRRPLSWLRENYPAQASRLYKGSKPQDDDMYSIFEYLDCDETVIIVKGKDRKAGERIPASEVGTSTECLARIPNRTGICPVVIAGRVTLDRLQGQFDQMMGMYTRQAKLDALNFIAISRSVFPDEWVQEFPQSQRGADIIVEADGRMGIRGEIKGGQIVTVNHQQNQDIQSSLDNLERSQRLTGLIPAELGGESANNIRTARRGGQVLGSAIDMPIQELQEILASSMERENYRAVKIQKSYYGSKPTSFFMAPDGKVEKPDYTPNDTFEVSISKVKYSLPGADVNEMIVGIGQRTGIGIMSKETAMELDPLIQDPISERDRVEMEGLRQSLLTSIEQGVTSGQIDATVIARIAVKKLGKGHLTLEQAVVDVHNEMQKEQADQANQQQQQQAQPEQQPGIAAGPQNPPVAPQSPPQLSDLLASLHGPAGKNLPPALVGAGGPAGGTAPSTLQGALGQEA